ncbi:hypothetical protein CYMTET_49114, partial [Cymbomonas tetramitiformis]
TSFIVLVELLHGEGIALLFGVVVAFIAIMVHLPLSPFKNDAMDRLQLIVLINQFIIQLVMLHGQDGTSGSDLGLSITLVVIQFVKDLAQHEWNMRMCYRDSDMDNRRSVAAIRERVLSTAFYP